MWDSKYLSSLLTYSIDAQLDAKRCTGHFSRDQQLSVSDDTVKNIFAKQKITIKFYFQKLAVLVKSSDLFHIRTENLIKL